MKCSAFVSKNMYVCGMFKYLLILFFLFYSSFIEAQISNGSIAKYSFNHGKFEDDLGDHDAKAVGVSLVEDRFGNPKHACYLHGNYESYLNLGTSSALKPMTGSISIWVRIENIMYKGSGINVNPIILTKSHRGDDFFEGYFLGIDMNSYKVNASSSFDSTHQVSIFSTSPLSLNNWHHLVLAYDDEFMWVYVNNKLDVKMPKNFRTRFLATDSV